jgi:hypothetical protein
MNYQKSILITQKLLLLQIVGVHMNDITNHSHFGVHL